MKNGVKTYLSPPKGSELASGKEDFVKDGRRNIGLKYILWSELEQCWQQYEITEETIYAKIIKAFVERELCYIIH